MGLLNNFFLKEAKKKKSVFDLFQVNIKNLPDSSFIDLGFQYDKDGLKSRLYTKTLDYLECGIFSEIEILIGADSKSVEFSSKPSVDLDTEKFCKLTNLLYRIYGIDDTDAGIITSQEIRDYFTYGGSLGRFWYKGNPWISISAFSVLDNIISLQIKGIPLEHY